MSMASSGSGASRWICCQLGAREHYAVPRALHFGGVLQLLLTDAWVCPGSLLGWYHRSWRERFHPALDSSPVDSANASLLRFELSARLRGLQGWSRIMARNQWFQVEALSALNAANSKVETQNSKPTLFAYSYAALDLFRFAKAQGWHTVLGQIDAGPAMERAYAGQEARYPRAKGRRMPPPPKYWQTWQEECSLADRIIVNSRWARDALVAEQVAPEKIDIIPLAYEAPGQSAGFCRSYPAKFSAERPLRVLFLGQVNLLKGIMPLLEAMRLLAGEPVELYIVGPHQLNTPEEFCRHPQIRWIGPVPRGSVADCYQKADVFIFPTLSDGFGLTQLEAQSWSLPIIASQFCGEVVQEGVNGLVLNEVTAEAIEAAVRKCLTDPGLLADFSRQSVPPAAFSLDRIQSSLRDLFS